MIHVASSTDAVVKVVQDRDGESLRIRDFIGTVSSTEGPQGFLVNKDLPIKPHFHRGDQYQVVVAGGGRIGKEPVHGVTVHYTDGFTPYGPIVPDERGIWFFTLRNEAERGAFRMPGSREHMERKAGRALSAHVRTDSEAPLYLDAPRERELWDRQADGLAAWVIEAGPAMAVRTPEAVGSGGQYLVVTEGSVMHESRELPRWSCLFVGVEDEPPALQTGASGVALLVLQFPVARKAVSAAAA